MDKIYRIAKIAVKIGKSNPNKPPSFFYDMAVRGGALKQFFDVFSGEELAYFSFMASQISQGLPTEKLGELYKNLQGNLFAFAIVQVYEETPTESCDYCGGDGEVTCEECDGSGEIDCDECGGSGEDDEGEKCMTCDGFQLLDCGNCNKGYTQCDNCYGSGDQEKQGYVGADITHFLSIDSEIFNSFELLDGLEPITTETYDKILRSDLTILTYEYQEDTDSLPSEASLNDLFFLDLEEHPDLSRKGNAGPIYVSNLSDL